MGQSTLPVAIAGGGPMASRTSRTMQLVVAATLSAPVPWEAIEDAVGWLGRKTKTNRAEDMMARSNVVVGVI